MKVESKFNIGDEIWFMAGNVPTKRNIEGIRFTTGINMFADGSYILENQTVIVQYFVAGISGRDNPLNEAYVYASKEELKKAIFKD